MYYSDPLVRGPPLRLTFASGVGVFSGTIGDLTSGRMTVVIDGAAEELQATSVVGPNEALCDASGGAWTDDDPDPQTGLYCLCPSPRVYVPSAGGCVPP
jgi:hypothetical protein